MNQSMSLADYIDIAPAVAAVMSVISMWLLGVCLPDLISIEKGHGVKIRVK